ncbi:hypothetical protein HaLaN_12034 [Haematococcus lacustris]|uniref:Uncharacterized protein n=1 Tax=Haematococcus lacustris TaxID=44745 RepID=A0A699ZA76_HAELA|nr:hypothetical protein HaLaN_12034 [Haematococcus lacustris]
MPTSAQPSGVCACASASACATHIPFLALPLAQQGLVGYLHPLLAWLAWLWHGWAVSPVAQLSGTWPWADCTAADVSSSAPTGPLVFDKQTPRFPLQMPPNGNIRTLVPDIDNQDVFRALLPFHKVNTTTRCVFNNDKIYDVPNTLADKPSRDAQCDGRWPFQATWVSREKYTVV